MVTQNRVSVAEILASLDEAAIFKHRYFSGKWQSYVTTSRGQAYEVLQEDVEFFRFPEEPLPGIVYTSVGPTRKIVKRVHQGLDIYYAVQGLIGLSTASKSTAI